MSEWKEKVIIVTGASEGIGRALALGWASRGARLALAARNADRLGSLCGEIEALGGEAIAVPTDVSDQAQCVALVEQTVQRWGRIDALVNNAGISHWTTFDQIDDLAFYERIMKVNFHGAVYLTKAALPHLKKSGGRLAAVSSALGFFPAPTHTGYCASKQAMFGFFGSLAVELKGSGVSVTMIAPGFVDTEIHKRSLAPNGKPLGKNPVKQKKYVSPEKTAEKIIAAIEKRKRLLITAPGGNLGRVVYVLFPGLIESILSRDFAAEKGER